MKPQAFSPLGGLAAGLISMGAEGLHPLFAPEWIRRAFDRVDSGLFEGDALVRAHAALKHLGRRRRLDTMRAYLDTLPVDVVDVLVFLYFRSVDQFIESHSPNIH